MKPQSQRNQDIKKNLKLAPPLAPVEVTISEKPAVAKTETMTPMVENLLSEIKKAYMQILQEKEEQILLLRSEVSDLKTLISVSEQNNQLKISVEPKFELNFQVVMQFQNPGHGMFVVIDPRNVPSATPVQSFDCGPGLETAEWSPRPFEDETTGTFCAKNFSGRLSLETRSWVDQISAHISNQFVGFLVVVRQIRTEIQGFWNRLGRTLFELSAHCHHVFVIRGPIDIESTCGQPLSSKCDLMCMLIGHPEFVEQRLFNPFHRTFRSVLMGIDLPLIVFASATSRSIKI